MRLESSPLMYSIISQDDAEQLYAIYPDLPKSHLHGCPSCGKNHGDMVNGTVVLDGIEYECNCQDQLQRHKHYLNAGIGLTYQVLDVKDFHGDQNALLSVAAYIQRYEEMLEIGKGIFLYGEGYGTGKTMLAYLALKWFVLNGKKCYATTYADMLSSMKAGWKDEKYAKWYRAKVDSAQVLVLDDVGKELMSGSGFNNDFSRQTLDGLIRTRTQQSRPTIITTNMDKSQFVLTYGEQLHSLIKESMVTIHVTGEDYRNKAETKPKGQRRIY